MHRTYFKHLPSEGRRAARSSNKALSFFVFPMPQKLACRFARSHSLRLLYLRKTRTTTHAASCSTPRQRKHYCLVLMCCCRLSLVSSTTSAASFCGVIDMRCSPSTTAAAAAAIACLSQFYLFPVYEINLAPTAHKHTDSLCQHPPPDAFCCCCYYLLS